MTTWFPPVPVVQAAIVARVDFAGRMSSLPFVGDLSNSGVPFPQVTDGVSSLELAGLTVTAIVSRTRIHHTVMSSDDDDNVTENNPLPDQALHEFQDPLRDAHLALVAMRMEGRRERRKAREQQGDSAGQLRENNRVLRVQEMDDEQNIEVQLCECRSFRDRMLSADNGQFLERWKFFLKAWWKLLEEEDIDQDIKGLLSPLDVRTISSEDLMDETKGAGLIFS